MSTSAPASAHAPSRGSWLRLAPLIAFAGALAAVDDWSSHSALPGRETKHLYGETSAPFPYIEYLPGGYDEDPARRWPLILALHGGMRSGPLPWGTSEAQLEEDVMPVLMKTRWGRHFPAVILNPTNTPVPDNTWVPWQTSAFIYHALATYRIDPSRIYVVGGSGGGYGCYNAVYGANGLVTAIVPCPGYGKYWPAPRHELLKDVAIWAYTGQDDAFFRDTQDGNFDALGALLGSSNGIRDDNPLAETTRTAHWAGTRWEWTDGIGTRRPDGGAYAREIHYTLVAHGGHDQWTLANDNEEMWDWLFRQARPDRGAPGFASAPPLTATVGVPYTYVIRTTGSPKPTLRITGAPSWMTLDGDVLSGTPTEAGDTHHETADHSNCITLIASNGNGPDCVRPFIIRVGGAPGPAPAGTVRVGETSAVVGEGGDAVAAVTVLRVGGSVGEIAVDYRTVEGGATAGDYVPTAGTLTWSDGDASPRFVAVAIADDRAVEGDESLSFVLESPRGTAITAPEQCVITIVDDDRANAAPTVDAGADHAITMPEVARLDAAIADDGQPEPSTLTIAWSVVSGPGPVRFSAADAARTDAAFDAPGEYVLRIEVVDGAARAVDEVTVSVRAAIAGDQDLGFERPAVDSYAYEPTGGAWTFTGAAGVSADATAFTAGNPAAPQGRQVAFLQATGSVSQVLGGFTTGQRYVLRVAAAQRGNWQDVVQDLAMRVEGAPVGVATPAGTAYQDLVSEPFTASAPTQLVAIVGLDSAGGDNTAFIDDVRIEPAADDASLLGRWRFDDGQGEVAADSSGHGHHGQVFSAQWTDGVEAGGIRVDDGATVYIGDAPGLRVGGDDFTVALWIRPGRGGDGMWRALVRKGDSDAERTFGLWLNPDSNRVHYRISTTASWNEGGDSAAELPVGAWTHVAYVRRGGELALHLDGAPDSRIALAGAPVANAGAIWLGGDPWWSGRASAFDDLRLYGRALGDDEIRALATASPRGVGRADHGAADRTRLAFAARP